MISTILCLELTKSTGGPSRSVKAMRNALDANVISWNAYTKHRTEALIWDTPLSVESVSFPVLKQVQYPGKGLSDAESLIKSSNIISCHTPWRWHMIWLKKVANRHKVPYWFVPHGGLDPYVFRKQPLVKKCFMNLGGRKAIDSASCVIFTTEAERRKALNFCSPARSEVIYWPLSEDDFCPKNTIQRDATRKKLGIPSDAACFLFLGRLDPMKRPLETIKALSVANKTSHLIMVGNDYGVSAEECIGYAEKCGIEHRVHVVGAVYGSDKKQYFSAADVYVSFSHRENFNYTAAESMAAGLPVLLSKGNDLSEELPETCGFFLEKDSINDFAKAINQASIYSLNELEQIGTFAKKWAEKYLSFEEFRNKIQHLAAETAKEVS